MSFFFHKETPQTKCMMISFVNIPMISSLLSKLLSKVMRIMQSRRRKIPNVRACTCVSKRKAYFIPKLCLAIH